MTGGYTIAAACAPVLVVLLEVTVLRTGILRLGRFWLATAITLAFQVPVDGWLSKAQRAGRQLPGPGQFGGAVAMGHPGRGLRIRARDDHFDPDALGTGPGGFGGSGRTAPAGGRPPVTDARRAALLAALRLTVRGGLAGVWVRGHIPAGPTVLTGNHHSWWDPFVAGLVRPAGAGQALLGRRPRPAARRATQVSPPGSRCAPGGRFTFASAVPDRRAARPAGTACARRSA